MKPTLHAAGLIAGLGAVVLGAVAFSSLPAHAQRTRFQGISQCSRFATAQFSRTDPTFRRFVIERVSVHDDKFANLVGNQFVSTVYYGRALYEGAGVPKRVRFICLHGGTTKGPVFVYALPE
jgi:hypothetical protein